MLLQPALLFMLWSNKSANRRFPEAPWSNSSGPSQLDLSNTLMQTDVGFASTADQPNRYLE